MMHQLFQVYFYKLFALNFHSVLVRRSNGNWSIAKCASKMPEKVIKIIAKVILAHYKLQKGNKLKIL